MHRYSISVYNRGDISLYKCCFYAIRHEYKGKFHLMLMWLTSN